MMEHLYLVTELEDYIQFQCQCVRLPLERLTVFVNDQ